MLDSRQPNQPPDATHTPTGQWQPILAGPLRERAWETVEAIAEALRTATYDPLRAGLSAEIHGAAAAASLSSGAAGLALFFDYLAQTHVNENDSPRVIHLLEEAMEQVANATMSPAFHGGFTGVGWAIAHLLGRTGAPATDDPNAEFDEFLRDYVSRAPWTGDYDLIGGLVGIGIYALERLPRPIAIECLAQVITRLEELAEQNEQGIAWFTPSYLLPAWQRELCPNGYYNLGLAHGIPGVVALLGHAYAAGVATAQAQRLLEGAVPWLLAQTIEENGDIGFASWQAPEYTPRLARLAWCYGDPGVAAALLVAAHSLRRPAWEAAALTIARRAAQRPTERAGVVDAGLCHGAAGLGHLFNRIYQATGDPVVGAAAHTWLQAALDLRQPGQGVAGYLAWSPGEDKSTPWAAEAGLLTGAAGVALALLAATTSSEPAWDRMLLIDAPLR